MLARVLAERPDNQPITVWLSPVDHATLTGPNGPELLAAVDAGVAARLTFRMRSRAGHR